MKSTSSTPVRRFSASLLAATLLAGGLALPAHAQDRLVRTDPVHATKYLNGGIGSDEQQHMRAAAKDWPLKMVFSERRNDEFVANVDVRVMDAKDHVVLDLNKAGPMTYAMLPSGTYRITASFNGVRETHQVKLKGNSTPDVYFHWS